MPGLAPSEASERLSIVQAKFDELWRKYITYSSTSNFKFYHNFSFITAACIRLFYLFLSFKGRKELVD